MFNELTLRSEGLFEILHKKRADEYYIDIYDKKKKKYFNTNYNEYLRQRNFYTLDEDTTMSADILAIEKITLKVLSQCTSRFTKS